MTETHSRLFDFHGCVVAFRTGDRELADWIAADFSAFPAKHGASPEISIFAEARAPGSLPRARFRTGSWHILSSPPGKRAVWYPEGALCEYDFPARRGIITSASLDLLKELSFLLILSRAGEALDQRGLHRLHAGALGFKGRALLFCGPQGAGKTTLLMELLKDKDFKLLSDDTPLISRDGIVHCFPSRIGLGQDSPHLGKFPKLRGFKRRHYAPKLLLDIGLAGLELSPPLTPAFIFKLSRGTKPAFRPPGTGAAAWELAKSLVAGYGVPQLAEYYLRMSLPAMARNLKTLASRIGTSAALMETASFTLFEASPDHAANAAALKAFLHSNSARE